jgi:hypothetical protein
MSRKHTPVLCVGKQAGMEQLQQYTYMQRSRKPRLTTGGDPLRWPRNNLYPQKLAILHQQAAVARSV